VEFALACARRASAKSHGLFADLQDIVLSDLAIRAIIARPIGPIEDRISRIPLFVTCELFFCCATSPLTVLEIACMAVEDALLARSRSKARPST